MNTAVKQEVGEYSFTGLDEIYTRAVSKQYTGSAAEGELNTILNAGCQQGED